MPRLTPELLQTLPFVSIADMRILPHKDVPDHRADEPLFANGDLPLAGFRYEILDGGMFEAAYELFGMERLSRIRQLSYLTDPLCVGTSDDSPIVSSYFPHTRLEHVFDTAAIMTLMLENQPDLTSEEKNLARLAAFTHDALIPAGGDMTKPIDVDAFDEDIRYPELFQRPGWSAFAEMYGINEELLAETILNRGRLGALLDYADKLAYVSRDAEAILQSARGKTEHPEYDKRSRLFTLLKLYPRLCGWWSSVSLHGDAAVVEDARALAAFCEARTLLFRHYYFDPIANIVRLQMRPLLAEMLSRGDLQRDDLLRLGETELEGLMEVQTGRDFGNGQLICPCAPKVESFATHADATSRRNELLALGRFDVYEMDVQDRLHPGLNIPVWHGGNIVPLREALPEQARAIARYANVAKPFMLATFPSLT